MLVYLIPFGKKGRQFFLCRTQRYSMERLEIINFIWWRVRNSFPDIVFGMYVRCKIKDLSEQCTKYLPGKVNLLIEKRTIKFEEFVHFFV